MCLCFGLRVFVAAAAGAFWLLQVLLAGVRSRQSTQVCLVNALRKQGVLAQTLVWPVERKGLMINLASTVVLQGKLTGFVGLLSLSESNYSCNSCCTCILRSTSAVGVLRRCTV
jgi:hypothetical protein